MATYETEEEQVEAIKKWLKENGFSVLTGIAVGFALLGGWRWWQDHSAEQAQQASAIYEQMLFSLEKEQTKPAETEPTKQTKQPSDFAGKLLSEHSNSPYAVLATLNLARQELEKGDISGSHTRLQWVIDQNNTLPEFTHIARLRKARLFLSQEKRAEAKNLIEGIDAGAFKGAYAELKGDIAVAENQLDIARTAYTEALASEDLSPKHREWVLMKQDDLGPEKKARIEMNSPLSAIGNPSTTQDQTLTVTEPTTEDAIGTPSTTQDQTLTVTEPTTEDAIGTPSTTQDETLTVTEPTTEDAIGSPSTTQDKTLTVTEPTHSDDTEDTSAPVSTQE